MSYIGNTATQQAFTPAVDFFNGNGSTTAFTLSRPVASVAQVQVVISNVPQKPGDAYTVSGNTITFTSAPPSGTQNIYVYYTSPITQVIAPGQGTVGTAQLQDNAVITQDIADGAVTPAKLSTGAPTWTSAGNMGLGVTPSAWSQGKSQEIGYLGNSVWSPGGNEIIVSQGAYYNGGWKYSGSSAGAVSYYSQITGIHRWNTAPSGTAGNAITFTQAMTLDASGNLLVGGTAQVYGEKLLLKTASGDCYTTMSNGTGSVYVGWSSSGVGFMGTATNHAQTFYTNGSERARIDTSGNLIMANRTGSTVGQIQAGRTANTGSMNGYISVAADSSNPFPIAIRGESTNQGFVGFFDSTNTEVGRIGKSGSNTTYVTSSDYRLKHDIQPMVNALAKVAALKPCTYKWNADGSDGQGFIAHELAEVCHDAVHGEKDAVDEHGNPQYQGIDTSFLVATLTAAIQEQQAIIETLTNRITALESK